MTAPTEPILAPPAGAVALPVVSPRERVAAVLLDVAHRVSAIALFATVATYALLYVGKGITVPLAIAFVAADVAGIAAGVVRLLSADAAGRRRTTGLLVFNAVVVAFSLHLMLLDRVDYIGTEVRAYFTPQPAVRR